MTADQKAREVAEDLMRKFQIRTIAEMTDLLTKALFDMRNEALEESAKLCERVTFLHSGLGCNAPKEEWLSEQCAAAIRAAKTPEGK